MTLSAHNEASTRTDLIDTQLARAGWSRNRRTLIEEFLLKAAEPDSAYGNEQFADYVLLGSDGKPIAVVEAKRSARDEIAGKRQAADYADAIKAKFSDDPFIFLTNGKEIQFWDRDRYPPRKIAGFYTRDDLERLRHQRQYSQPLHEVTINADIAGRDYQNEAIRRITEGIDAAKRKFLLVMATGTGKTRTTIALVDTLQRSKRIQRVLFLADRRELVRQATSEFMSHLPNESLARIEAGETSGARIQFSTYPSMMQVYSRLSVGYYDLIVADESHRSIYQRYKAVFDHFDAIQLGLTATPTDYIDHNTFDLFDCGDGAPSYYYSYEQAIADKNLVNYRVLDAQTNFQLQGIQGDTLPEPLKRKPVHNSGDFADWFHPYLRPAYGALALKYQLPEMAISCVAVQATDQPKVNNLNKLLNLDTRWTREFKAEHRKKQKEAADRKQRGRGPHNLAELQAWLTDYRESLVASEPNYEVHKALAAAMLEPTRLATWQGELGLAP